MNDAKAKEAARLQSFAEQLDRLGNSQMLACLWKRAALENWNAERKYIEVCNLMQVVTGVGAEDMDPQQWHPGKPGKAGRGEYVFFWDQKPKL